MNRPTRRLSANGGAHLALVALAFAVIPWRNRVRVRMGFANARNHVPIASANRESC
jgi:hypothetical protein